MTSRARRAAPLIVPGLRRPVLGLVAVVTLAVTALGVHVAGGHTAGHAERRLTVAFAMRRGLGRVLGDAFAELGNPWPVTIGLVLLAVLAARYRGGRGLALALSGPPVAMLLTSGLLKPLIDRTHGGGLAYPSGHTTAVASLAVAAVVLLLGTPDLAARQRAGGAATLGVLVVAVAVSLVGRGYHYPLDTVGGAGVAASVVLAAAAVVDRVAERRTSAAIRVT